MGNCQPGNTFARLMSYFFALITMDSLDECMNEWINEKSHFYLWHFCLLMSFSEKGRDRQMEKRGKIADTRRQRGIPSKNMKKQEGLSPKVNRMWHVNTQNGGRHKSRVKKQPNFIAVVIIRFYVAYYAYLIFFFAIIWIAKKARNYFEQDGKTFSLLMSLLTAKNQL